MVQTLCNIKSNMTRLSDSSTREMSRELDELILLFTRLNTNYTAESARSKQASDPRALRGRVSAAELPPPVRFERRRKGKPTINHTPSNRSTVPSAEWVRDRPDANQNSTEFDFVFDALLSDNTEGIFRGLNDFE